MKILLFTLLVIFLLVSCSPSKCSIYDTLSYIYIDKWEHKSIPQKGMLYISGRKSFIGQKDSIPVINIFTDELDSTYITCGLYKHEIPPPKPMGKYEKPQRNDVNSTERSDILVFNCYLCHVRFLLTCYVCSTKIGEISDISKCFKNFVSQALGVLARVYAAELR